MRVIYIFSYYICINLLWNENPLPARYNLSNY